MSGVKGSVRGLNEALDDVLDGAVLRYRVATVEGFLFKGVGIFRLTKSVVEEVFGSHLWGKCTGIRLMIFKW